MTSKTRLLLQTQNGRKITIYFLSVTALDRTIFFSYFRKFLLLTWCQRAVMECPYTLLTGVVLGSVLETATENGAHTIEVALKTIAFKPWEETVSFFFKIHLKKRINAINETFWCSQNLKKVLHMSHWCFLNDLMDMQPDSNLADILLFKIVPAKFICIFLRLTRNRKKGRDVRTGE